MSEHALNIGLCGLGTVGSGVVHLLQDNESVIDARSGAQLVLTRVGARRDRPGVEFTCPVSRDIFEVARDPEIDVVVELIGGTTTAFELVKTALEQGKHVVTANKALIAEHGKELISLAESKGLALRFEAAVAGGIPIIKALREGLAGNRIQSLAGIINGTGNFILTEMAAKGRDFEDVLAEAQALGYAEADPTFDVDGTDAAHKLVILASVAFGVPLAVDGPFKEGINRVEPIDLEFAAELGFRIKHLGIAQARDGSLELRVHPTLLPSQELLSTVDGVLNAVRVKGNGVGEVLLTGAGAGALPTASAVLADLVDIARSKSSGANGTASTLGVPVSALSELPPVPADRQTAYYLRMRVEDRPGVMADITAILSQKGIGIESILQKPARSGREEVPVVILTDRASQASLDTAIDALEQLDSINGSVARLRVEDFQES